MTALDYAIIEQLAAEFYGSLAALENGNLEGLEMADTRPSEFELGVWENEGGR